MKKKVPPRIVPERDEFYLGMAFWYSRKSKDPKTQIGSVIISPTNEPLGWGYNGPPGPIRDTDISWGRPEKYDFVIHAEINAMRHSRRKELPGSTMYVTAKPCKNCMLNIVSERLTRVVWYPLTADPNSMLATTSDEVIDEIARMGNVRLEKFTGNLNWMRDDMAWMEGLGIFG